MIKGLSQQTPQTLEDYKKNAINNFMPKLDSLDEIDFVCHKIKEKE